MVKNGYVVKTLPANAGPLVQSLVQESKRNEQIRIFLKSKELFHLQEMYLRICSLKSSEKKKVLIRKVHKQRADHLR